MIVLFIKKGTPIKPDSIRNSITTFGNNYNQTVREIIKNSENGINKQIFSRNVAILMTKFKMTRSGPFKGVKFSDGKVEDPNEQIATCWERIGNDVVKLRNFLIQHEKNRSRVLVEISPSILKEVDSELWQMFKKLVPICMGKYTLGLVAASKVLFSVLPEVALPIDNVQWRTIFKTIDYGDIILRMAEEIIEWESIEEIHLDSCAPYPLNTLPSIYNIMAMKARNELQYGHEITL